MDLLNCFYQDGDGVHVQGPIGDYSLCGYALEGTGDGGYGRSPERPPMVSVPPQDVTCVRCLEIMDYCKRIHAFLIRARP